MPVAFLGALLLLMTRTCSADIAKIEVTVVFGDAGAKVRSVQVEVFRGDEREALAEVKKRFDQDGVTKPVTWKLQLDPGMYKLEFRIVHAGKLRQFTRSIKAVNDAKISIDVEPALRRNEPPPE